MFTYICLRAAPTLIVSGAQTDFYVADHVKARANIHLLVGCYVSHCSYAATEDVEDIHKNIDMIRGIHKLGATSFVSLWLESNLWMVERYKRPRQTRQ